MTSDQELGGQKRATYSPVDLKQIKDAVNELRTSSPRSVLADLVEEKIRAIESNDPAPRLDFPLYQGRRAFS